MVVPDDGGGLDENEVGFEVESLDCVVEEAELEENLGSAEVMEEGVRTGCWFRTLVSTDSMEELRALGLLEDGLASLRKALQEGVEGVDGGPLPTSPADIVEGMTDVFSVGCVARPVSGGFHAQFRDCLDDASSKWQRVGCERVADLEGMGER